MKPKLSSKDDRVLVRLKPDKTVPTDIVIGSVLDIAYRLRTNGVEVVRGSSKNGNLPTENPDGPVKRG